MYILFFQIDKTIPMHLRRKLRQDKPKPKTFEMMPPSGFLMPGQRINVQVKFMPTEEVRILIESGQFPWLAPKNSVEVGFNG